MTTLNVTQDLLNRVRDIAKWADESSPDDWDISDLVASVDEAIDVAKLLIASQAFAGTVRDSANVNLDNLSFSLPAEALRKRTG